MRQQVANAVFIACTVISSHIDGAATSAWHITRSWPTETVAWLRAHEVPDRLRRLIDEILLDEKVVPLLSELYMDPSKAFEVLNDLEVLGFRFLKSRGNVFVHERIPGYVFKFGQNVKLGQDEVSNLCRVAQAERVTKRLASAKQTPLKIIVPRKWVYITPALSDELLYMRFPKVFVVAEEIKPEQSGSSKISEKLWKQLDQFLTFDMGLTDWGSNNIRIRGGYAIIDTECRSAKGLQIEKWIPGISREAEGIYGFKDGSGRKIVQYGLVLNPGSSNMQELFDAAQEAIEKQKPKAKL